MGVSRLADVFHTTVRVRYQETDQMGVVYHSNYFVWFEVGRTSLIRKLGVSYRDLEAKGIILPVIEANCTYQSPARYEDVVRIETTVAELTPARNPVSVPGGPGCGWRSARQWVYVAHVGQPQMKPVNLRRKWPDIYQLLQAPISTQ